MNEISRKYGTIWAKQGYKANRNMKHKDYQIGLHINDRQLHVLYGSSIYIAPYKNETTALQVISWSSASQDAPIDMHIELSRSPLDRKLR